MTFGYSVSLSHGGAVRRGSDEAVAAQGHYKQIDKHPIASTEQGQFEAARFIANVSYEAIKEAFQKSTVLWSICRASRKFWLERTRRSNGHRLLASRLPRLQEDQTSRDQDLLYDRAVKERKRTKISLSQDLDAADVKKACNAIAPNFIHGCDSAHVHRVICKMLDDGTAEDFFMIHDSFSVSGDAWDLYDSVRNALVEMYIDDCRLCRFEDEIRNQLNDPAHVFEHRIPEKGDLDREDQSFLL